MRLLLAALLLLLLLSGCASYQQPRTDLVNASFHLSTTTRAETHKLCGYLVVRYGKFYPYGCVKGDQIIMYRYPIGEREVSLNVQFIPFGTLPYMEENTLYMTEYPINDYRHLGYVGDVLAEHIGLPKTFRPAEILAHEFMHILGYND